ncbi:SH3 domain-containing protein [Synechococcus sp. PCC 7502]|uniref:SH3 domain-containing protein n=1 Tax=Synechococcus sp. PCC 7502 TaxID=1173263 RepID=UPI00029FD8F3|nr:SH3 domain-containing protein [Synechococcus sp. PCC 7502]AFY73227.1 SH3 domain-containing protein [Synechococcus sp. PCC 7502]
MRLARIIKSTIVFAFILGIILACVHVVWQGLLAPYLVSPSKPMFKNQSDTLYKDRLAMPIVKFSPPPKPQPFKPIAADIKYKGKVNVSRGLVLRSEPKPNSNRVGGVEYKADVSVLKETPDKEWVYIQVESSQEKGWVRSGNIFRN